MKRIVFFFLLFLQLFPCFSSGDTIALKIHSADSVEFYSLARYAWLLEDKNHELSLETIRNENAEKKISFTPLKQENANLDFTTSSFWVKFKIINEDSVPKNFLLETARPLTNIVNLYTVKSNGQITASKNGDEIPFGEREISHRKILFPVQFLPNEELSFYLQLRSDGEVLTLPVRLWHPQPLMKKDYHEQYMFGFYYGILIFVVIINFFFYVALREKSFLYYVLYVFSIAVLQMSLDGLSFQYLWPSNTWWANHVVVISATLTAVFVLFYAKTFLKLKESLPAFNKVFNLFIILCSVIFLLTFTGGKTYALAFPLTNALSLLSALLVPITIAVSVKRGNRVSYFFTLAFISLISGAIIFILSNFNLVPVTFFTEHSLKYGSALEIILLSLSMANKYREIQQEKELAQAESLKAAMENEKLIREQNTVLEQKVKERTAEVVKQKEIIEEKNKDITDSINYARGIQQSILPPEHFFKNLLPDSFILYKPRDIVSGDFYWASEVPEKNTFLFAVCDCTGHGVPGGFVSMVSSNSLSRTVNEQGIIIPAKILDRAALMVEQSFSMGNRKDGMDAVMCSLEFTTGELQFAGANNPLYVVRKKENGKFHNATNEYIADSENDNYLLFQVDADKQPVGAFEYRKPFTNHNFRLKNGDSIYLSSDGFRDQFGGPKGKKFMAKNFKQLLLSIQPLTMEDQKAILLKTIDDWMKGFGQNDDICIIGVRI